MKLLLFLWALAFFSTLLFMASLHFMENWASLHENAPLACWWRKHICASDSETLDKPTLKK